VRPQGPAIAYLPHIIFKQAEVNVDELSVYVSEITPETKRKTEIFKKFYDLKL